MPRSTYLKCEQREKYEERLKKTNENMASKIESTFKEETAMSLTHLWTQECQQQEDISATIFAAKKNWFLEIHHQSIEAICEIKIKIRTATRTRNEIHIENQEGAKIKEITGQNVQKEKKLMMAGKKIVSAKIVGQIIKTKSQPGAYQEIGRDLETGDKTIKGSLETAILNLRAHGEAIKEMLLSKLKKYLLGKTD